MDPKATQPPQLDSEWRGLNIPLSSQHLRNLAAVERARLRILSGWFLRIGNFEYKYKLAYHLYDASEHITWIRSRLKEMRGGNPDASVRPELTTILEKALHAPSDHDFLAGFYGVVTRDLLNTVENELNILDTAANANEVRILQRIRNNLQEQLRWYDRLEAETSAWANYLQSQFIAIGGIHGDHDKRAALSRFEATPFERPQTLQFDESITKGQLTSYERRMEMDSKGATIEQFKVFFNELYAAALLASILFDASNGNYPWEFFADFSRHFWDEARHSEFGAIRLRELGVEPDRVNLELFEESQSLPVLHRVAYLTRGLEAYFMPRKPKRVKEYEENGDIRSQLFADQDWSDEINHVRYGSRWTNYLLENDHREVEDIIEEVKEHLSRVRNTPVHNIEAPY